VAFVAATAVCRFRSVCFLFVALFVAHCGPACYIKIVQSVFRPHYSITIALQPSKPWLAHAPTWVNEAPIAVFCFLARSLALCESHANKIIG